MVADVPSTSVFEKQQKENCTGGVSERDQPPCIAIVTGIHRSFLEHYCRRAANTQSCCVQALNASLLTAVTEGDFETAQKLRKRGASVRAKNAEVSHILLTVLFELAVRSVS